MKLLRDLPFSWN